MGKLWLALHMGEYYMINGYGETMDDTIWGDFGSLCMCIWITLYMEELLITLYIGGL